MIPIHGIQQRHCQGIERARRARDQATWVLVGGNVSLSGLGGAAYDQQDNRESAAGRGRL